MTHFTVLVCTDGPDGVDELLAPYDENITSDPRRVYEEGAPEDHWAYRALKQDYEKALQVPKGTDQDLDARARLFLRVPAAPTWEDIAALYNSQYGDGERMQVDREFPDGPRAYTITTYNPDSKWDWYQIGGRWSGSLVYRPEHVDLVLNPDQGWSSPLMSGPAPLKPLHCDGGPKYALDLEAVRDQAEARAQKTAAEWQNLAGSLPPAKSWAQTRAMLDSVPGYTIEKAREDYHSQPLIQALRGTDFQWADDPVETFRDAAGYIRDQRLAAVPGWALVRRSGEWLAPGEMGLFAASSDDESSRAQYYEAANAYIDSLPDEAWLTMVDCHI